MPLLIGRYAYTVDSKNRLFLPPKFREALQGEGKSFFILTSGLDGCLYLFLPSQWEMLLANNLQAFSLPDKEQERAFKRKFFAEASEVELDAQGRILVPQYLKEYAALKTNVLVQGAARRVEIWAEEKWKSYCKTKADPTYRRVGKNLEL